MGKKMLNIMSMLKDVVSIKKNEEIPTVSTNEHSTTDFVIASESVEPFKMDVHIEIPLYRGELDPEQLDGWLKQLDVYFSTNHCNKMQKITFAILQHGGHALTW